MYIIGVLFAGVLAGFFLGRRERDNRGVISSSAEAKKLSKKSVDARHERREKRKARVLAFAKDKGKVTVEDVEEMFCYGESAAGRYVDELEKEGKLVQIGKTGPGVYYEPV